MRIFRNPTGEKIIYIYGIKATLVTLVKEGEKYEIKQRSTILRRGIESIRDYIKLLRRLGYKEVTNNNEKVEI